MVEKLKKKKRILITEDEKPYARALTLKLQNVGYDSEVAEDGEIAVSKLKVSDFDLILLDLVMPKLNGFGVLEWLQQEKKKVPVIVLSNLSQMDDEKKARSLGASDFLSKSNTSIAEVIKKIETALGKT